MGRKRNARIVVVVVVGGERDERNDHVAPSLRGWEVEADPSGRA